MAVNNNIVHKTPAPLAEEKVNVHTVRSRHAKKALRSSVHQHLRIAIIGTSPTACAIARALGRTHFAHVTLFTNGERFETHTYVDSALLEKAFTLARASAFPGDIPEMAMRRSRIRIAHRVGIDEAVITSVDPMRKELLLHDKRIRAYDVLLIPTDDQKCVLENRSAETHRYISSGDDVMALHPFFAARVESTPKRDPIDIVCDTSLRVGREILSALTLQLPAFASRYGHPKETIHIHDVAHVPHQSISEHEIHVHVHREEQVGGLTAGELLAHAGHIILPSFGVGLSGVDVVHAVLSHISLYPMRPARFGSVVLDECYLSAHRARIEKREGVFIYILLRIKDFRRAIRAYGFIPGISAWRKLKV